MQKNILLLTKPGSLELISLEPLRNQKTIQKKLRHLNRQVTMSKSLDLSPQPTTVPSQSTPSPPFLDLGNSNTLHSPEVSAWIKKLILNIRQFKNYPALSVRNRETGKVTLFFEISPMGQIVNYAVKEPSPHPRLNQAALDIFKNLPSVDPIPKGMTDKNLQLIIPLEYSLD